MRKAPSACVLAALALTSSICTAAEPARASSPPDLPRLRLEPFGPKLDKPVQVVTDPAGRLFIIEQVGRARLYHDGQPASTPYLDLTKKVYVEYECGLLGIAFHPKFAENGYLYANYTAKVPVPGKKDQLKTFISEFKTDPKASQVDPKTERVVLAIDQPFTNHNGGHVEFGPDGMLYIGMGDGGSAHDPHDNGQKTNTLLGKMLRIDVTPRERYAVPKDNPFVGKEGWAPEIWALGLRNPWRFSFDPVTGLMYEGDVGQDLWEEINIIEKGGNYGWRIREGMHDLHPVTDPPKGMIDPIYEYHHNNVRLLPEPGVRGAASVTGGCVYRGKKYPLLRGWYFFGDYSHGVIYGLKYENGKVVSSGVLIDPRDPNRNGGGRATQPSAFGEDAEGDLYLCDANGPVYRIVPSGEGRK
jgi:glucose/arabinose dehydrogenase